MNKEITFNSKIPHFLYQEQINGKFLKVQKIYDLLNQNLIARDSENHFKSLIESVICEIEEESSIVNEIKFNITEFIRHRSVPFKVHGEFSELKLCNATSDKIFFTPQGLGEKDSMQMEVYKSIIICTLDSIDEICPILPFKIQLIPGETYDIEELISKVSAQSSTLKIIDPYIYNKYAVNNLKRIASIRYFKEITVKMNPEENSEYSPGKSKSKSNTKLLTEVLKDLERKGSRIRIEYFKKYEHQQRYILFDEVQVEVPGGLDFLDPQGKYSDTKEIGYLRFEKREI